MAHTVPFTEEIRYKLALLVSFFSVALNSPRLALIITSLSINQFLVFSEN